MSTVNAYISIGNSDDKLTQWEWSQFVYDVQNLLTTWEDNQLITAIHGTWFSLPHAQWQNANWCVEIHQDEVDGLREHLARIAHLWKQDSIALTIGQVEFVTAKEPTR